MKIQKQKDFFKVPSENNTNLKIKTQSQISENESFLLKKAGLDDLAPIESWTAIGTNAQLAYSTHGIVRFFGKFPPPIANHLIAKHTAKNGTVLDPMTGSGTTGVEALLAQRNSLLFDVNPLMIKIAKVKTTYIPSELLIENLKKIQSDYENENYNFELSLPIGLRDPNHWFLPETIKSLSKISNIIQTIDLKEVKDFFQIVFAGIVRRVSKATTQQGRLFLDIKTAQQDAFPFFLKKSKLAIERVSSLPNHQESQVKIFKNDIREPFPNRFNEVADLVILHPPYFNSYKFSRVNALELGWLGIDPAEIRKKEVKEFFKVGKSENIGRYVDDMAQGLKGAFEVLKTGGVLALMVGDTIIKDEYIPTTKMLIERCTNKKILVETVAIRVPKYTEASWAASQRRLKNSLGIKLFDFVITFRKR